MNRIRRRDVEWPTLPPRQVGGATVEFSCPTCGILLEGKVWAFEPEGLVGTCPWCGSNTQIPEITNSLLPATKRTMHLLDEVFESQSFSINDPSDSWELHEARSRRIWRKDTVEMIGLHIFSEKEPYMAMPLMADITGKVFTKLTPIDKEQRSTGGRIQIW
jgi:hypothetical protein